MGTRSKDTARHGLNPAMLAEVQSFCHCANRLGPPRFAQGLQELTAAPRRGVPWPLLAALVFLGLSGVRCSVRSAH
jgi:hypothetical protein